jgi:hypothetical protein
MSDVLSRAFTGIREAEFREIMREIKSIEFDRSLAREADSVIRDLDERDQVMFYSALDRANAVVMQHLRGVNRG